MIYGSLTLASTDAVVKVWPQFSESFVYQQTQHHVRGTLRIAGIKEPTTIHLPQRSKSYAVSVSSHHSWTERALTWLGHHLPMMESEYEFTRQLYKMHRYMQELKAMDTCRPYIAHLVNQGDPSHVGLMAQGQILHVLGAYDTIAGSVQLVWTTDTHLMGDVRTAEPGRYVFYRMPVLADRPLFLFSPALVSKWIGWVRKFQGPDCILRAFNALELYLYKEAEVPTRSLNYGQSKSIR
jgi:hypothetical protein